MRQLTFLMAGVALLAIACGPAPSAQQAAKPAAAPQQPAAPSQPAVAQPAPAQQPQAKPAAQPARPKPAAPAAEAKPVAKPAAAEAVKKVRMLYGSSSAGSSWYVQAIAVAKLWNAKVAAVEVTNRENGGCLDTLRQMASGEVHAGIYCSELGYQAWHGLDAFKDKPIQVQRILFSHTINPQAWLVRRDAKISRVEELQGKDFIGGAKGTATEKQSINILDLLSIKPKYYNAGLGDMVQVAKDRRVVGFVKGQVGTTIDAATQEIHLATPLDMIGFTPEQEKKILEKYPYYSFMAVSKDAFAPGFPSANARVPAVVVSVVLHKDIPEDVAYQLTKASIEDNAPKGEQTLASAFPTHKGVDFAQFTVDYPVTPLHAGTVKYLKEVGKQVKAEQLPPDAR